MRNWKLLKQFTHRKDVCTSARSVKGTPVMARGWMKAGGELGKKGLNLGGAPSPQGTTLLCGQAHARGCLPG